MPALIAACFNPDLKAKYQQMLTGGKPAKIAITAIMRKLIVTANALLKADRCWQQSRLIITDTPAISADENHSLDARCTCSGGRHGSGTSRSTIECRRWLAEMAAEHGRPCGICHSVLRPALHPCCPRRSRMVGFEIGRADHDCLAIISLRRSDPRSSEGRYRCRSIDCTASCAGRSPSIVINIFREISWRGVPYFSH